MKIVDYIHQGGAIMYILLALNIFGVALMLYKFFGLNQSKKNIAQTAVFISQKIKEIFSTEGQHSDSQAKVEITLREFDQLTTLAFTSIEKQIEYV